jgi:hypothetical protein
MAFAGINYIGVVAAAIAGFVFGAAWYGILSKPWIAAVGTGGPFKPSAGLFILSFLCQLVMAWMLAGVVGHLGDVTVLPAMISAAFLWVGFVMTTMIVNHRFQHAKWSLTVIDGLHWLGVLLVMGAVIGLIGV